METPGCGLSSKDEKKLPQQLPRLGTAMRKTFPQPNRSWDPWYLRLGPEVEYTAGCLRVFR